MAALAAPLVAAMEGDGVVHLEPPSWWIGMQEPVVQLMLHARDAAALVPAVAYPGVAITATHRVANPNYLFIDVHVAPDARPGTLDLTFARDGAATLHYGFQLQERAAGSAERRGFDPSDVIYLITPDRYANGDPANDRVAGMREGPDRADPTGRHGGDLQGLLNSLDYVAGMGFTQIWLNPILENDQPGQSYHGYAATDYYRVDARYGDNALYRRFCQEARARGIGVIQDVVPNHIGSEHWWMQDLPSPDWVNNAGRFAPTNHQRESLHDPHGAATDRAHFQDGWFAPTMPDLDQRNPLLATYLIQNSIWWVEYAGLSGLRVDTYSYPDKAFMAQWTHRLTDEYPNLNIVGEEWSLNPAIVAYWQRGAQRRDDYDSRLPSLMDFPLQAALIAALEEPESWGTGLIKLYQTLANDFQYADPYRLVVFADNHDMSRLYTQLDEDDAAYRLAMTYLLTTRGIPQIYYGTEILMTNPGTDAHGVIRSDFPGGWAGDRVDAFTGRGLTRKQQDAQAFLRQLLTWRKTATAVHAGKLTHYAPADGIYVYFRDDGTQRIMVILNKAKEDERLELSRYAESVRDAPEGVDVLSGQRYALADGVPLPARSAVILDLH